MYQGIEMQHLSPKQFQKGQEVSEITDSVVAEVEEWQYRPRYSKNGISNIAQNQSFVQIGVGIK